MEEPASEAPLAPVTTEPATPAAPPPVNWKRRFKLIGLGAIAVLFLVFMGFNREQIEIHLLFGKAQLQGGIMFLLLFISGFLVGRGYSVVVRNRRH